MPNPLTNQIERNIVEDNIIKDTRNLFRLKKEKENNIKDKIIRNIRTLFESDEEDCYEPRRICNAFRCNYIEYESNGDQNKTLSIEDHDEIRPYLNNMINDHKTQGEWKTQLTIAINLLIFFFF